jgi:DNA-binding HxlR family transcriptional regulator
MVKSSPTPELDFCPRTAGVLEILGKRWTALIVFLLLQRPARFSELARTVPGLSERVLAERLRELEEAGLVERRVDHGPPIAVTYRLTARGEGLGPTMDALRDWAAEGPAEGAPARRRVR